jgi:hypothetical protein
VQKRLVCLLVTHQSDDADPAPGDDSDGGDTDAGSQTATGGRSRTDAL